MTGLSADNVGIGERGRIAAGLFADLVLIDPDNFHDNATFEEPQLISSGVKQVWVNGVPVFIDGAVSGNYPGRIVSRRNFEQVAQ